MALLKVKLRGKLVSSVVLQPDKSYTAGRKEDCDILLQQEKGISREHFQIHSEDGQWKMKVLSRFGDVLVDGQKIESLDLGEAAAFAVPPYEFEFTTEAEVSKEAPGRSMVPVTSRSPGAFVNEEKTMVPVQSNLVAMIKFLNSRQPIRLEKGTVFLAGRETSCPIHIEDQRVSRRQFEIKLLNDHYIIMDLGSVNGTFLNGKPLHPNEPTPLNSGDVISVLDNQLIFELHDPNFENLVHEVQSNLPAISDWAQQDPMQYPSPMPYQAPYPYQGQDPGMGAAMPQAKAGMDPKKRRIRMFIGVGAVLVLIGFFLQPSDNKTPTKASASSKIKDPLAKLNPEQKRMVKHHYELAENYLAQQKWTLAKMEIEKIKEMVPGYQDYLRTRELENHAEQGIINEQEIEKIENQQKQMALQEEKIQQQVVECKKLVNPQVKKEDIENCIQPVLQFNPEHPQILALNTEVDQIVTQRLMNEEQKKEASRQAEQLRQMFARAEGQERSGDYLTAIKTYEQVSRSGLPDRGNYKARAQKQIGTLKSQINTKSAALITEADKHADEQNYKAAILALRKAQKIDPENAKIIEKTETYIMELKKLMLVLFQEGVLEEGFGNIEGSEGKPGAKDKWKRILELDIPEGEYYKKARQRLKKYGVVR